MNNKGFISIEIIVVVIILTILMAIVDPAVMKHINEVEFAKGWMNATGE